MKVYLDSSKISTMMMKKGYHTLTDLCNDAGIKREYLSQSMNRRASPEMSWLIADLLECDIKDLWSVDWTAETRRRFSGRKKTEKV
ncbi:MAG: helix-turn-helix domain-containing protein [Oscillospiraceae bacterium]